MDATRRMQLIKGRSSSELGNDAEEELTLATGEGEPSPNPPMVAPVPPNPKSGLLPLNAVGGVPNLLNIQTNFH